MKRTELDMVIGWAAAEGWNPGLHDAECFFNVDPDGFFIAELSGRPIGAISAVAYDRSFGFVGLFIVVPEHRGNGIGMRLWRTGLEYLGQRNVGLDGVLAMQDRYAERGFGYAHRNVRYEGRGGASMLPEIEAEVVDLREVSIERLSPYDAGMFPAARPDFLRDWTTRPGTTGFAALSGDALRGYGVLRPCISGYKIGPLMADDEQLARSLFAALSAAAPDASIYLDTPQTNAAAVRLAESNGMTPVFETARMYTADPPPIDLARVFGITSFELG